MSKCPSPKQPKFPHTTIEKLTETDPEAVKAADRIAQEIQKRITAAVEKGIGQTFH